MENYFNSKPIYYHEPVFVKIRHENVIIFPYQIVLKLVIHDVKLAVELSRG